MNSLCVCITNFKRPAFLHRAIKSCVAAGIQRIAVFSMEPDKQVLEVIRKAKMMPSIRLTFDSLPVDLGCQETWIQAVYRASTKWVIVLHDDDMLAPEFGAAYREIIEPALDSMEAGFASWRGHVINERNDISPVEYFSGPTRICSSSELASFVSTPGRLSLSPVVSVFNRAVLISALKECENALVGDESHLHPGMTLGTEIVAYLRHCSSCPQWLYVDKVLSFYGSHADSGTVKAQQSGSLTKLTVGYDFARAYCAKHPAGDSGPKLLFVFNEYKKNGIDEQRRCDNANYTWQFHFNQGTLLPFPVWNTDLPRSSSELGDPRPVPYVKDLIDYGMLFATRDDIVVIANRDICLTTTAPGRISEGVEMGDGFTAAIRRNWPQMPSHRLRRTVLNCKPDGGYDLFAMTRLWWMKHRGTMPDMLLGREAWDTVLRRIAEDAVGKDAYVDDATYHEYHHSFWLKEKLTNPGQIHNRRLGTEFFKARNDLELVGKLQ